MNMKRALKIAIVSFVLIVAITVDDTGVPDVSKWDCPGGIMKTLSDYEIEIMSCDSIGSESFYVKVSRKLIYIHEHRKSSGKTMYYNALKTNEGNWVETFHETDLIFNFGEIENRGKIISFTDDNGRVFKRTIPSFK